MSGRFVRASKYRHVFGEPAKPEKSFQLPSIGGDGDGNLIAVNGTYVAFAGTGGGGPLVLIDRKKVGRVTVLPTLNVHKAKVLDWQFSPFFDRVVATASDDCTAKISVLPEVLHDSMTDAQAVLSGHEKKVTLLAWHPTAADILATGSYDNTVRLWDVTQASEVAVMRDHPDQISSLEYNADGSLVATACKDKHVRVFDPRAPKVQASPGLEGVKQSKVFWASPINMLGVVGFSKMSTRQYAVYDVRKMGPALAVSDLDNSAGVVLPFYDPDTSIVYLVGKGDASIKYFEVTPEDPYVHFLSEFRNPESQKGCCFLPKRFCDVGTCEIAVAYRVLKNIIQPVSFQVPRKSDLFQADIFPDTYAGVPSLTASDYLAGKNAEPRTTSLKPGEARVAAAELKVSKPVNQQQELDAARARIAELEKELAAVKLELAAAKGK